jgi:hypothetical protein
LIKDKCSFLDIWITYINQIKADFIKKDEWGNFYTLIEKTKGDFKNFLDDGCWCTLIDEFNAYYSKAM